MEKIIKTAGILICLNNKVLLVRHGEKAGHLNDTYGIPAGRIELGEKSIDAAVRELFEETGLITSIEHLEKVPKTYIAAIARKDGIKTFSQENFLCKHWDGEIKSDNETIPEWVNITELDKLKLLPNVKKMISDVSSLKQNGV